MFKLVVLIVSLNSNCTGFILSDGFVVTAAHCPKEGTANGNKFVFVKADTKLDVMLLKTPVKGKAKFAYTQLGEEVSVLGYSGSELQMLTKGHVASFQGDYILLDITVFKGESGSAVFNKRGEIVAMVVGGVSDGHMNLVVALSSAKIRGFVK